MIQTFFMKIVYVDGSSREFGNLSRVAVKKYKKHFEETLVVTHIIVKPETKETVYED